MQMQRPHKKIGLFGGTFDPIHFGHLNLALEALEQADLDRLYFCPAFISPDKSNQHPSATGQQRLDMLQLALEPFPFFETLDWEIQRQGPSYTIDTVDRLKQMHPEAKIFLLLGEDLLQGLSKWKEAERLLSLVSPLVGMRHQRLPQGLELPGFIRTHLKKGLVRMPLLDISSTQIRQRLREGKPCVHLLPAKVLDYIHRNRLYC